VDSYSPAPVIKKMVKKINPRKEYRHNYYLKNRDRELSLNNQWRKNNKEKLKDYHKSYKKEQYKKNPRIILEWNIKWRKKHKDQYNIIHKLAAKRYREKYPEKIRARTIANKKLKHLKKKGYEFHHDDYSKPLDIKIIPIRRHKKLHHNLLHDIQEKGGEENRYF
jgi:hypothetical protein